MPQPAAAGLDSFLAAAAHDLREPLHTAVGYLDVLERNPAHARDPAARECLDAARAGLLRMRESLQAMLAYARADQRLAPQPVDLDATLAAALADVGAQVNESGCAVESVPLPVVQAHPDAVRRILQNLLSNAMKYRGPAPPRIRIRAQRVGDQWRVDVADNGRGIAHEDLPRLFQPYRRLASSQGTDGTGLGLAMSARLAQAMGGRLWADSEPGQGTVMHLLLPEAPHRPDGSRANAATQPVIRGARGA